ETEFHWHGSIRRSISPRSQVIFAGSADGIIQRDLILFRGGQGDPSIPLLLCIVAKLQQIHRECSQVRHPVSVKNQRLVENLPGRDEVFFDQNRRQREG